MSDISVRLESIVIENFKNVRNGTLHFENKRKDYKASILGIYGQNGSGKTAVIDAIKLLKYALCGQSIPAQYCDYINVDSDGATLKYQFKISQQEGNYQVWYQYFLRKVPDESNANNDAADSEQIKYKAEIINEILEYSFVFGIEKMRKCTLINTETKELFIPRTKHRELIGDEKNQITDLLITKLLTQAQSRSFVFSRELVSVIRKKCHNKRYRDVLDSLIRYGNRELFVIDTENTGLISMNALPLSFKYAKKDLEVVGNMMIPLNAPAIVPQEGMEVVDKVINNMNIVLGQIVPGLTISVVELGAVLLKDGKMGRQIQLMSLKNKKEIPFQYESEGIKKIVSILQLLIVVYNHPSITVAVDELDSGIFEYLLGELINIISEKGKGQLIFTSHNLRPLETIDKGFVAFTTTNPKKRYIRMMNVKENNNLRDFYYRDIVLGEQSEELYQPTNNYEIALAFREAGEAFGS